MPEYTNIDQEQNAGRNLLKTAAGIGFSFIAFAAFQGPLTGLTKAVSQRAGLLMRSFSPTFRTAWGNAARTIGREEAAALAGKSMHQPAQGVEKFLSTFGNAKFQQEVTAAGVKELPGPMRVLNQWAQIKSPTWGTAYQSAVGELANFEAAHAPNSKWFRSALRNKSVNRDILREEFQLKYAKDFFAKSGREKRIAGAGIKWFGAYAATAPAFYLADKATGLLTGQGEEGRKKRSAWNIPGKLWDFTKWSVGFAPADMVFRGAGSALKLAKARGVQSANKFFSTTEGQKISSELLSGLNKGKQFVQQVLGATIRPLHHANMAYMAEVSRPKPRGSTFFGGVVHNATQGIKGAVAGARAARSEFDIARRGGVYPVKTAASRFTNQIIETVAGMHAQSSGIGFKPGREMTVDALRENMGKALSNTFRVGAPSHNANFLEKVLALRPKIMRRSDLNSFIDAAEAGSSQVGSYNLKASQQLFGGSDTFRMAGLYEQGDISWLNRKHIKNKLATTALKFAIHIPFTNKIVNPAQFFHVHDLLEPNYLLDANRSRIALPNPEDLPESTRDSLMMGFAKEGGTRNRWDEKAAREWLTGWKSKFKSPEDVRTAQSNWLLRNNVVESGILPGQSEKIVSTFSLVGAGRSSLAVGGNLFYTDTFGNMTRVAGYKATPVQNRYVQIMSNMLYPASSGAAFKDHDQVVREQNLSPWGAVKDKVYRRLELGPYANKEQAQGIFAPKTMWRNLTDRKSYRNTFGAEPSSAAEKDFAMEELGRQFGISGFTKKTGMPAHYPGLVPIVDNKNAIGILQQRYGGVQTGNAVIDQHSLQAIASDPFTAAQVLLEQARDGQYVPGVMKKFAQDVLTNRNLAAVRESGVATKGQLLRSAALANRLEQINVPLDQVLGDQIPEALRPYLKFSAINKELDSIIQGRNPAVVATKVKARFMDILKSQEERGMMHEIEQQRSLFDLGSAGSFANDYLSGNFNKLKLAPILLSPEQLRPSFGSVLSPTAGNMTAGAVGTRYMAERAAGFFGVRTDTSANSAAIFGKIISHRVLPVAGAALAYRLADAFTDENPLFAGTMLDEGIGVAAAEQVAKAHLLSSRLLDASGITQLSKYTEGLLPGSVNSPLFRAARTIGLPVAGYMLGGRGGNLGGAKRGMLAGLVADAALGFGLTDLTKAHDELVEEYSGRQDVAVRKNRFWEFGKGPFAGGQIDYYRPNWFARVKAQHQATADQYGSKWESLLFQPLPLLDIAPGSFIAPHYYARKHYLSRPYPTTGSPGSEAAIIGPVLGKSLSFLGDVSSMHQSEMESVNRGYGGGDGAGGPSLGIGGVGFDGTGGGIASSGQFSQVAGKQFYYGITEPMGLFGWAGSMAAGGQTTALSNPYEMATSGSMTSQSRKFWNLNLGGGFLMTEGIRRLMPRKLAEIKEINPLANNQADWLPERFRTGDPFTSVNEGELRLPGTGYESMHSVEHTFPGRSSMVGYDVNTMVAKMLGIAPPMDEEGFEVTSQGTAMHRRIQADLMARNIAIKAESNTYDPYADVSGTIDLILQGGAVGEIKTKSRTALQKLTAPSQAHLSQLNLYLHTTKAQKGYLIYAAREDSNMRKVFEVNYSKARYQKDVSKLKEARMLASQLIDTIPTTHGASYSHVDRLSILGDLAPTSDEYYKELGIATDLKRRGMMSPEQQAKYETTLGHRQSALRVGEMYPTRFKGNLMSPATTYDLMSENTNIKAASEYNLAERAVGAAWEGLQNVSSPVSSKFFNYPTPSEAYRRAIIYDNLHQNWGTPYESFVEPYGKSFMSSTNPASGAWKGSVAGFLTGGPFGAVAGAVGGAAAGATLGTVKATTGWSYLSSDVKKNRNMQQTLDRISYAKNMMDYQTTGNPESLEQASNTLTAFNTGKSQSLSNFLRAVNPKERPYLASFINVNDPKERKKILGMAPQEVGEGLQRAWNGMEGSPYMSHSGKEDMAAAQSLMSNRTQWEGFDPNVSMKDVKLSLIKNEGLDNHDFGMGYAAQQRQHSNLFGGSTLNLSDPQGLMSSGNLSNIDNTTDIRRAIEETLRGRGGRGVVVTVTNLPGSSQNSLIINCTQDRTKDLITMLREPNV